jgi:hypothetical protein
MRTSIFAFFLISATLSCSTDPYRDLAKEVRSETLRSWKAYEANAWGYDGYNPIAGTTHNWYDESMYITLIDAYSTLHLMNFTAEAARIETFISDSADFNKDIFVKTFEINIRVLGGLLSMYEITGNPSILAKAQDLGDRLLPAFDSPTGLPYYSVNLATGDVQNPNINVAEAGSYLIEFGILSQYTGNPAYYQAAIKSTRTLFERRSDIGLLAENINVESGLWLNRVSHIGSGADSYFEYLYKAWLLFGDDELKRMWDVHHAAIQTYLQRDIDGRRWYGRADYETGSPLGTTITLWDAYYPALLSLAGHVELAEDSFDSWNWLWTTNNLVPMVYDAERDSVINPSYILNPEVIESAWYLYVYTADEAYREKGAAFWSSLKEHTRTETAFTALNNVQTGERLDELPSFFFAETMKYLYLLFMEKPAYTPMDVVLSTEAHPFKR